MPTTYAIPDGRTVMAATTYTGNADFNSITNSGGFQPDFVWVKERSEVRDNILVDSVRGVSKALYSNLTSAEGSTSNFTEFLSNGFKVGYSGVDADKSNKLNQTYVGWQWKAGGTAVSNTAGSITSQVSANTTAGFSVVTYTGTGANATVGHGLGVAPNLIIVRNRTASAQNWQVYSSVTGATKRLFLDLTDAAQTVSTVWNNTEPTSTVFSIGTVTDVNGNTNNFVAYCFSAVAGYSAFGSYTANGSADGPFVYLGFRPRFVMFKDATAAGGYWEIHDTSRSTYNATTARLWPNVSSAEATGADIDFLSNGFKVRTTDGTVNNSGSTVIYMAFAENPFKYANAR